MQVEKSIFPSQLEQRFQGATTLDVMLEYSRYLYENELARTDKLNETSKTFILFISSTFTVLLAGLTWLGVDFVSTQTGTVIRLEHFAVIAFFLTAVLVLVLAFVFAVLSVKIRSFERLCDPVKFVTEHDGQNIDLVKKDMTANFTVATARNFDVNSRKAAWLFKALYTYLGALILFFVFLVAALQFFIF